VVRGQIRGREVRGDTEVGRLPSLEHDRSLRRHAPSNFLNELQPLVGGKKGKTNRLVRSTNATGGIENGVTRVPKGCRGGVVFGKQTPGYFLRALKCDPHEDLIEHRLWQRARPAKGL
jgi:hypothetical protein